MKLSAGAIDYDGMASDGDALASLYWATTSARSGRVPGMPSLGGAKYRPVKTPTVLQMESAECGAAALGIILEYHGRYVPLDTLRVDCGVSRDGSNALYIKEAARRYGLETKAFRKPADGLGTRQPPFMVLWQWNHFLVVEGFGRGKVYLNDPASGRRAVSREEFARCYSGIAFTFSPGPQFVKQGGRPSTILGLARRLASSKRALGFVILAGLALLIPTLLSASFQRVFFDEILIQGRRDWLKPVLIAMGLTALVRLAAVSLQQAHLTRLEIRLALSESVRFLKHVLELPLSFYQQRFAGDIVSRIMSAGRVARLISGELATTTVSLLTLVVFVAAMLPHDPLLTLVGVAVGSLNLIVLRSFSRWRIDQNRAIEQIRGRLAAGVVWAIQIIETIKATGSESDLMVRWTGDQARVVSAEQRLGVYDTILVAFPPLLATLTSIVVLGLGGARGGRRQPDHRIARGDPDAARRLQPTLPRSRPPGHRGSGAAGRSRPHRRCAPSQDRSGARAPARFAADRRGVTNARGRRARTYRG